MPKKKIIITIICVFLTTWYLINFPIQKHFAEKEIYKYMQKQGIQEKNIKNKKTFKNYLFNGYCINVKFKNDPKFEYRYEYTPDKGILNFKQYKLSLIVYDENGYCYDLGDKNVPKYLPLKYDLTYNLK